MKVEIKDGRGEHRRELSKKNYRIVKKALAKFPGKTKKEYCKITNLCFDTVKKYIDLILSEDNFLDKECCSGCTIDCDACEEI